MVMMMIIALIMVLIMIMMIYNVEDDDNDDNGNGNVNDKNINIINSKMTKQNLFPVLCRRLCAMLVIVCGEDCTWSRRTTLTRSRWAALCKHPTGGGAPIFRLSSTHVPTEQQGT